MELSWSSVVARRMSRHGLSAPLDSIPSVVSAISGVHAQLASAAELSIGARVAGIVRADVQSALWQDRSLVKTYGPRGTVHLLVRDELPLWSAALSAAPGASSMPKDVRLSDEQTDAVVDAIAAALTSRELDGDELSAAVIRNTGPWAADLVMPAFGGFWPRWRQAIVPAAHRGVLSFGPNRGSRVTYTSPGLIAERDPDAALSWLVHRYLVAYGPATPQQFARWMAAPPAWGRRLFAKFDSQLERVRIAGALEDAYVIAGDTNMPAEPAHGIRLLPHFDAYAVGSHPRDLVFAGAATARALARGQAGNFPVMLVDGVVGGVWTARRTTKTVDITVEPVVRLTASHRRKLSDEADRVASFLELESSLTIGPVLTRAHA